MAREKSAEQLAEIDLIRNSILQSSNKPFQLSSNLSNWLKEGSSPIVGNARLGIMVEEAISDPNINIIDEHVKAIVNPAVLDSFKPDVEEIKVLAKLKLSESKTNNLYRENLRINMINEQTDFRFGSNVVQWKTISLEKSVALIGKTNSSLILVIGSEGSYKVAMEMKIDAAQIESLCLETFTIWDNVQNRIRYIVLIAVDGNLVWHEIVDASDIKEIQRWRLMKAVDKLAHVQHDGKDLLMITILDESQRAEVQFIEFDLQNSDFWVTQAFKLTKLPKSIAFINAGRDLIVAFTQDHYVSVYRCQNHEKSKFSFLKKIDAPNVNAISGFRIGGHSYLAIGGDHPQILRYFNNDFHQQSILSQTFGHVEEFLAVPIKIYRDDLVLLVQHSIKFRTHQLKAVDALIWNGIAFESALSVPCEISADPNANGFTCMLDIDREEGLLGASFVVMEKNSSFYVIIPRHEDHSGLFKIEYEIIDAEDPLMKEIDNIKKAIALINGMLDLEMSVKQQVDKALKTTTNPKETFHFSDISLDEIEADVIQFDGNVTLSSDKIDFLDVSYTREDFMVNLEDIEKTLIEDEQKVMEIDALLNSLIRKNRQVATTEQPNKDSPIHYLGPYTYNGQFDVKTLRVVPQKKDKQTRLKRQVKPIDTIVRDELKVFNLVVNRINDIPVEDIMFLESGILNVPNTDIVYDESIVASDVIIRNDGKVNGIDFKREVLAIDSQNFPKTLNFDSLEVDYFFVNELNGIPVDNESLNNISTNFDTETKLLSTKEAFMYQNLNVKTINGINWQDLLSEIVLVNRPSSIENLTVTGNVIFVDPSSSINVQNLNGLAFPGDYVLKTGPTETLISGAKNFTRRLCKLLTVI